MNTLFISFTIAIGSAIGIATLGSALELDTYLSRIFPLIPILYAIVYETLDRRKSRAAKAISQSQAKAEIRPPAAVRTRSLAAGRIAAALFVSISLKTIFETVFLVIYMRLNDRSFFELYGSFSAETVGRFLRGDHPWLAGPDGIYLLTVLAIGTSLGTGLWIGFTSSGSPVLEGVLTGTIAALIGATTNMLAFYQEIESAANMMAESMGYVLNAGFGVVLAVQVLLYGLWSGAAEQVKRQRRQRAARKKKSN